MKTELPVESKKCAHCGCEVDFESEGMTVWDKQGNCEDVCSHCYDEHVLTCQICGEEVMPHEVSSYIVVKVELGECSHPNDLPGIYRVRHRPFMSVPMIGSPSLHSGDLLFVDVLPKPDDWFDISGYTCRQCAKRYDAIYWQAYAKAFADEKIKRRAQRSSYRLKRGWFPVAAAQNRRITAAFTKHPERLMDLECDPDELADEYGHVILPRVKTYHDYVALQHKGVTVYRCYLSDQERYSGWLLLRPEPRYRGMCSGSCYHNGEKLDGQVLFSACNLPTWKKPKDWPCHSSYDSERSAKQAILDAIDQGLLRQDGVFGRDGEPLICR